MAFKVTQQLTGARHVQFRAVVTEDPGHPKVVLAGLSISLAEYGFPHLRFETVLRAVGSGM